LLLRHVGQLTEHEIADVMGIQRGTVSSTLRSCARTSRRSPRRRECITQGGPSWLTSASTQPERSSHQSRRRHR
jgi:hypothetical protein